MKKFATLFLTFLFFVAFAVAQTAPTTATNTVATATLPTFVLAGASFNQIGDPKVNLIAGAVYPSGLSSLEYLATVVNIVPNKVTDPVTHRKYFSFTTTAQQSIHKIVYKSGKFSLLVGGGAGVAFTQASPSGTNASLAGSFTATPVWQPSPKWGIAFPVQGLYTPGGWNLVPTVAVVFKP